jgi:integrase
MAKLTALRVRTLAKPGRYSDGDGLYLQVRDAAHRSWLFRYARHGKGHWLGLGAAADVTLAEARDKARECRRRLLDGLDPIEARRAAQAASVGVSFKTVALQYIAAHESTWRNPVHRAQWNSTLESYAFPHMADLPVSNVSVGSVMKVLEPIWREKPETASRLRGRIESVLDFATARGWRTGDNPARWRGHLQNLLPARAKVARVEHHAALPWAETGAFMAALTGQEGVGARALAFTILSAARTGETIGARWAEIDMEAATWLVPGERMKAGRDHRVPLSGGAMAILRAVRPEQPQPEAYVFTGRGSKTGLSNMSLSAVLRRMGKREITVHGFRSTFRDWAAESTQHPRELAEAALAHTLKDKVEAAYRRGDLFDKRRTLMNDWAAYCASSTVARAAGQP